VPVSHRCLLLRFFFQAEDGIRDFHVTRVQTCALPILTDNADGLLRRALALAEQPLALHAAFAPRPPSGATLSAVGGETAWLGSEIGRASCRESVETCVVAA